MFTAGVVVTRALYNKYKGKTNIKKEINKRLRRVVGDGNGPSSDGFMGAGSEESKQNAMPGMGSEEGYQPSSSSGESKNILSKGVSALGKAAGSLKDGASNLASKVTGKAAKLKAQQVAEHEDLESYQALGYQGLDMNLGTPAASGQPDDSKIVASIVVDKEEQINLNEPIIPDDGSALINLDNNPDL